MAFHSSKAYFKVLSPFCYFCFLPTTTRPLTSQAAVNRLFLKKIAITKNSKENQTENSSENLEDNFEELDNTDNQNIGSNNQIVFTKDSKENQTENSTKNLEDNGEELDNTDIQDTSTNNHDEVMILSENISSPKTVSFTEPVSVDIDKGS